MGETPNGLVRVTDGLAVPLQRGYDPGRAHRSGDTGRLAGAPSSQGVEATTLDWHAPVANPGTFVIVGLNDADHRAETQAIPPTHPRFTNGREFTVETRVDGELRESGSTDAPYVDMPTLVSTIARFRRLDPGDVILTGTSAVVGEEDELVYDGSTPLVQKGRVGRCDGMLPEAEDAAAKPGAWIPRQLSRR